MVCGTKRPSRIQRSTIATASRSTTLVPSGGIAEMDRASTSAAGPGSPPGDRRDARIGAARRLKARRPSEAVVSAARRAPAPPERTAPRARSRDRPTGRARCGSSSSCRAGNPGLSAPGRASRDHRRQAASWRQTPHLPRGDSWPGRARRDPAARRAARPGHAPPTAAGPRNRAPGDVSLVAGEAVGARRQVVANAIGQPVDRPLAELRRQQGVALVVDPAVGREDPASAVSSR